MSALRYVANLTLIIQAALCSTFQPNCPLPDQTVNIVWSPNVRGTFNIVWSSLFTILVCTWTILHLNVPEQRDGRDPGRWGDLKWKWKGFKQKAKWMAIAIVFPEFLTGKAFADSLAADHSARAMNELARRDACSWTKEHAFFANMGGFILRPCEDQTQGLSRDSEQSGTDVRSTIVDSSESNAAVAMLNEDNENRRDSHAAHTLRPFHLTARRILSLRQGWTGLQGERLSTLPDIPTDEILDKSKADYFVKILAAIQVLWMVIQVITRWARHLPVSQLEILAFAFSMCSLIAYWFWRDKPQDVKTAIPIGTYTNDFSQQYRHKFAFTSQDGFFETKLSFLNFFLRMYGNDVGGPIPNDFDHSLDEELNLLPGWTERIVQYSEEYELGCLDVGFMVGSMILGGVHCAAWNSTFPTTTERIIWRISSVLSGGLFPLFYVLSPLLAPIQGLYQCQCDHIYQSLGPITVGIYTCTRLFLIIESFLSLRSLPPDAFVATFTKYIPHVA